LRSDCLACNTSIQQPSPCSAPFPRTNAPHTPFLPRLCFEPVLFGRRRGGRGRYLAPLSPPLPNRNSVLQVEAVELQLQGGEHGAAVCSVAVAPDVRWGVWEVLFGCVMQAPGGGSSSSSSSSVGDSELSLTLALSRALLRCPVDVRGVRGEGSWGLP
jgi:hypothetical protein